MSQDAPKENVPAHATNGTLKLRVLALKPGFYGSGKVAWKAGREYWLYKGPNGTKYLFTDSPTDHNFKRGIGLLYTWNPDEPVHGFKIIKV